MIMSKKSIFFLLAAMLPSLLCEPVQAAELYPSFEAAAKKVTDEGYVVFIYPAGWDRYGEQLCRKLVADAGVRAAAGQAAMLLAPIYQNRDDNTNAASRKAMGSLAYPHDMSDISYPAIVFYEKGGRMYGTLYGEELMKANPARVAELVQQRIAAKKKQDSLLARSNASANPVEKAKLLLESSRVEGIDWPGGLKEAIRRADPSDSAGCIAALNFGFGPQSGESMDDFLKRLDAALANPLLAPRQKQNACAAAIGHIRRTLGTMAGGSLISRYARTMRKLDPKSPLGLSAKVVQRDWVRRYRYGQGWSEEILPAAEMPMEMHDVPMNKPGTYNITFRITTGRDSLHVKKLRLMDGSRCVAADNTPRSVTWSQTQQTYTLTVKKALRNPVLEITFGNDANHRSTWGDITINQQ